MKTSLSKVMLSGLVGIGALALVGSPVFAKPPQAQNGTTLAASKTLDICTDGTNYTYSGEISVWNSGAVNTAGLNIVDCIEHKESGPVWTAAACSPDAFLIDGFIPGTTFIPAGTTQQTATVFTYEYTTDQLFPGDIRNSVQVTITNHSGNLGAPFGPNPKATWVGGEVPLCDEAGTCGCTLTQGYWANHAWPAGAPDQDDPFYTSGLTWYLALTTPPAGNKFYNLSGQYIAAYLNQLNGACTPDGLFDVGGTFALAQARFESGFKPADCPQANSCGTENTWAGILATYNEGTYPGGPDHCEE